MDLFNGWRNSGQWLKICHFLKTYTMQQKLSPFAAADIFAKNQSVYAMIITCV